MPKILIVDDEAPIRQVLSIVCKTQGYNVDQAENGLEAIELLKQQSYDLIITDLRMSPVSGGELAEVAHLACPQTKIIALTGWPSGEDYARVKNLGIDRYFLKPFSRDQFLQAVNELTLAA